MSANRAERRRRARIQQDGDHTHILHGGPTMLVEGDQLGRLFARDVSATAGPGEHVWVIVASWRVDPTSPTFSTQPALLDLENMLSISGAGCYVCEQEYTAEIGARPCPGDPSGHTA